MKTETTNFVNTGYGWVCKRCAKRPETEGEAEGHARYFREGEAEEKQPVLSNRALARWVDESRRALVCPVCGAEEGV